MTLSKKKSLLAEKLPEWQKLTDLVNALQNEINAEENPPKTSEELVAEITKTMEVVK